MIEGFLEHTSPLNEYEERVLLPVIVRGLRVKKGRGMAVKNGYMIKCLTRQGYKITAARMRKIINHIRINDIIPCLIATSEGYYIAMSEQELLDYEDSLLGREEAIRAVRLSIDEQRRRIYDEERRLI